MGEIQGLWIGFNAKGRVYAGQSLKESKASQGR
jgi:hypothetical protein